MADGIVRELITKLGFEFDEKAVHHAESSINKLKEAVEVLMAALAVEKLYEFFEKAGEKSEEIEKASARMGVGVEQVQKLKYAAEQSGVEFGDFSQAMTIFSKKLAGVDEKGGKATETLKKLGIDPKKTQDQSEILLQISDRFHGMEDGAKKTALALELFGRGGARNLTFLNKGSEAIKEMMEEAEALNIVIGEEGVEGGVKFTRGLKTIKSFLEGITLQIAAKLFPYLNEMIHGFVLWAKANKDVIATRIDQFAKVVAFSFEAVGDIIEFVTDSVRFLLKIIDDLSVQLTGSTRAGKIFEASLVAIAAAMLILESPILLIIALIAGLALIYDDVKAYIEGRPSLFKPVYDKLAPIIEEIRDAWSSLVQFFKDLGLVLEHDYGITWGRIKKLIQIAWDTSPLGSFFNSLGMIYDMIMKIGAALSNTAIGKFISEHGDLLKRVGLSALPGGTLISGLGDVSKLVGNRANAIREGGEGKNILEGSKALVKGNPSAVGVIHGDSVQNNHYNLNNKVDVKIDGAENTQEISSKIGDALKDEMDKLFRNVQKATQSGARS